MPDTYMGVLVRDSLQDVGVVPSPGYPYTSPDIICTQQNTYADPTMQFGSTTSYAADPNLAMVAGQNNNFYVRAKNLGSAAQAGAMYVYWSQASLLLTPNLWFNQPMTALVGGQLRNSVALPNMPPNQIGVAAIPFNWTPPTIAANDHFCLIGAVGNVSTPWPPTRPPTFENADAFALWVRNNQNICWRNLSLISNPNQPQWDRLDSFSNPWSTDLPILIQAVCRNVPVGTRLRLLCTALGIDNSATITQPNQTVYSTGATCPAGFNGIVETIATLPSGRWPPGASITTTAYVGMSSASPAAHLAHHFGEDNMHPSVIATQALVPRVLGKSAHGVLVAIGNTTTAYLGNAQGDGV